ncbi:hypothetical protein AB6A40_001428 [Gnathostoma spinigerum]|uniref:AD domain-containing protein n=1 Tax=Gnathostoma spinigerum TaxID=75299 RepID=A0ABD6EBJ4_9BILA
MWNPSVEEMAALCGQPVRVHFSPDSSISGIIYTIDPWSSSLVLGRFQDSKLKSIEVCSGESVQCVEIIEDEVSLPEECKGCCEDFFGLVNSLITETPPKISRFDVERKRKVLVDWLRANCIDVKIDNDGSVTVFDVVRIKPPYDPDSCYSDNVIVLSRLRRLIKALPVDTES